MKNTFKAFALGLSLLLANVSVCSAQDLQKGLEAAQKGDFAAALREWRPLAEQGDAEAQNNLGVMYGNGRGVTQDYKEAVKWYRLAADQGDRGSQKQLGFMYDEGQGVTQDYKEAMKWYRLVADQGDTSAQYMLGFMYAMGRGVRRDNIYAHMWWNIAASSGDADAVKNRDIVAAKMTPAQIAEAQKLAREWKPTK